MDHHLAGGSSPGELRAGRTGLTTNALHWPQTALKRCSSGVRVSQSCNHRSLPVRSQRNMMSVVRAYKGSFDWGIGYAIKISVPRISGITDFLHLCLLNTQCSYIYVATSCVYFLSHFS